MSLRPNERVEVRRNRYKVAVDAEEGRRRHEDNMVEIRKSRREESLLKKRREGLQAQAPLPAAGVEKKRLLLTSSDMMRGRNSHRGASSSSAAVASTSSHRDPEEEPSSAYEESGDEEEVSSSSGSESESDGDAEKEKERELERVLADVPLGELQRARADGSLAARGAFATAQQKKAHRESRKRPMEISTNVRPPRFREVIQVPKKVVRDPRFEPVYGAVDKEGFRKRYKFLFDDELPAEKEKLQKSIKKLKDPNAIEEAKSHITWIDKQLRSHPQKNIESEILRGHIRKERDAAKTGKQPYYLKKSEIRQRKLMDKYNELKDAGKLDAFIERRRKKNASKDHRFMPYRRTGDGV